MTSNPFSLNNLTPTWAEATEILKGDLPGHEFHGNQYRTADSIANAAAGLALDAERYVPSKDFVDEHDKLAAAHVALAVSADGAGNQDLADAHRDAAYAHEAAASANEEAIGASPDGTDEKAIQAERETKNAADESSRVVRLLSDQRLSPWS